MTEPSFNFFTTTSQTPTEEDPSKPPFSMAMVRTDDGRWDINSMFNMVDAHRVMVGLCAVMEELIHQNPLWKANAEANGFLYLLHELGTACNAIADSRGR